MKKVLLTLALIVGLSTISFAQESKIKYHSEVEAGFTMGIGDLKCHQITIRTIQGVKIGQYFSAGGGIGVDYGLSSDFSSAYEDDDYYSDSYKEMASSEGVGAMIPLFLNFKGYLPVGDKLSPYLSLNVGYKVAFVSNEVSDISGLMLEPAVGIKYKWMKAEIGYTLQNAAINEQSTKLNGIHLKVGAMF